MSSRTYIQGLDYTIIAKILNCSFIINYQLNQDREDDMHKYLFQRKTMEYINS